MTHYINRVLSKPFRLIILGWAAGGFELLMGAIFNQYIDVDPAFKQGPFAGGILGALMLVGAALASLSTLDWKNDSTGWELELASYPLLIPAWMMYTIIVFVSTPTAMFPETIGISALAACGWRLSEVRHNIQRTRRNVEMFNQHAAGGGSDA